MLALPCGWFLAQGPLEGYIPVGPGAAGTWRLDCGWRIHFQSGSFTCLGSQWGTEEASSSLPDGPLPRVTCAILFAWHWVPLEQVILTGERRGQTLWPRLRSHTLTSTYSQLVEVRNQVNFVQRRDLAPTLSSNSLYVLVGSSIGLWDLTFWPGIEPMPSTVKVLSPNHSTSRSS